MDGLDTNLYLVSVPAVASDCTVCRSRLLNRFLDLTTAHRGLCVKQSNLLGQVYHIKTAYLKLSRWLHCVINKKKCAVQLVRWLADRLDHQVIWVLFREWRGRCQDNIRLPPSVVSDEYLDAFPGVKETGAYEWRLTAGFRRLRYIASIHLQGGRDSSVGIVTCYGLDGPGNKSRGGRDFPHPSRPALGAHPTSCKMGTGSFPGVKRPGRGADHAPHLQCRSLKKGRARPRPTLRALVAYKGGTFNFFYPTGLISFYIRINTWGAKIAKGTAYVEKDDGLPTYVEKHFVAGSCIHCCLANEAILSLFIVQLHVSL